MFLKSPVCGRHCDRHWGTKTYPPVLSPGPQPKVSSCLSSLRATSFKKLLRSPVGINCPLVCIPVVFVPLLSEPSVQPPCILPFPCWALPSQTPLRSRVYLTNLAPIGSHTARTVGPRSTWSPAIWRAICSEPVRGPGAAHPLCFTTSSSHPFSPNYLYKLLLNHE